MGELRILIKKSIRNFLLYISAIVLVSTCACSPTKQLANIVARNPSLLKDTVITINDTIVFPSKTLIDTVFSLKTDTFFFDNTLFFGYLVKTDTLYKLKLTTKIDTVYRTHTRTINQYVPVFKKKRWPWWVIPATIFSISGLFFIIKIKL